MRHQRAQQMFAVDAVRLGPPRPLFHRNARGIEYQVRNPGRRQQPMQPKAVIAGFVTGHDPGNRPQLAHHPRPDALQQCQ
jgi:hypothetical protein